MNILLLGSGGREHTLAWKMAQSLLCDKLFIAPGNAGTSQVGENVPLLPTDFASVRSFVLANHIGMVVVGSEEPLVKGIHDFFLADELLNKIPVIGPDQKGARLEGSKDFAKEFMTRNRIPTARYRTFTRDTILDGFNYLQSHTMPVVLKADGLAAGKGVVICNDPGEAILVLKDMLEAGKFGTAGTSVVVEEFLEGFEVSVFVLTDGKNYLLLPEAKDYKRIGEGDTGLNTGGMGAVSPVVFADKVFMQKVVARIIQPTMDGLIRENIFYKGFIFFGLISVSGDPFVIEYNCRMGDPETEVVIPRLKNDLVELFVGVARGTLFGTEVITDQKTAVTVMVVSEGYPGDYKMGKPVSGLENVSASTVFHAGTSSVNGNIITSGGRVMAFTAMDENIREALKKCYADISKVCYEGISYRKDIGKDLIVMGME
jgi:phosphoribosylamine---glycine ligase